jgi:hypothetical protein
LGGVRSSMPSVALRGPGPLKSGMVPSLTPASELVGRLQPARHGVFRVRCGNGGCGRRQ